MGLGLLALIKIAAGVPIRPMPIRPMPIRTMPLRPPVPTGNPGETLVQPAHWLSQVYGSRLNEAIESAQLAQTHGRRMMGSGGRSFMESFFPKWTPGALLPQVKVRSGPTTPGLGFAAQTIPAHRRPDGQALIRLGPAAEADALGHELTHVYAHGTPRAAKQRHDWVAWATEHHPQRFQSLSAHHPLYGRQPTELDPGLAAIKRQYFAQTGQLVRSPQESRVAIEWAKQQPRGQRDIQTTINEWDSAGDELREVLSQRMTELVDNNQITTENLV